MKNWLKRLICIGLCGIFLLFELSITPKTEGMNLLYVGSGNSAQHLDYIVYKPQNVSADTPIFLFLHGDGEVNSDFVKVAKHYKFIRALLDGSWTPNFVFVMPLGKRKGNWVNEYNNVNIILDEVSKYFGGSKNNMYIGGASAGSDAISYYQKSGSFKGAICMAGHVGDKRSAVSANEIMNRWSGKKLWYFRDNLANNGGYGCDVDFLYSCAALAPQYNVNFRVTDLNWNHSYKLVDRVFLPENMKDAKGQPGMDAITNLIYQ